MRSRVRFLVLPWEFFLGGKDSCGDHGLGSRFRLKAPPGISSSCISPLTHHRDNVVAPHGRRNLRSRLHYRHNQEGNHESSQELVVALENIYIYIHTHTHTHTRTHTQGLSKRFERFKFGIFYVLIVKIRYNFTHK